MAASATAAPTTAATALLLVGDRDVKASEWRMLDMREVDERIGFITPLLLAMDNASD